MKLRVLYAISVTSRKKMECWNSNITKGMNSSPSKFSVFVPWPESYGDTINFQLEVTENTGPIRRKKRRRVARSSAFKSMQISSQSRG